jgi:hypothetical protein
MAAMAQIEIENFAICLEIQLIVYFYTFKSMKQSRS